MLCWPPVSCYGKPAVPLSLSALLSGRLNFVGHPAYVGITALILLAAFTKSAQFPFHFWLPNAMQAPTPVSAYLHSATMVKAGVYLVARMTPLVGGTALWTYALTVVGALTMIGGSYRAVLETDLKRILAYSTISALGFLMLLLGIGTPQAVIAAFVYLLAHACYKGALFLVAGAVEHETGVRDVMALAGLRRAMPRTALAAMLAAASMAGIPLFFGFIAKEQVYESVGTSSVARPLARDRHQCRRSGEHLPGYRCIDRGCFTVRGSRRRSPAIATKRRCCCG